MAKKANVFRDLREHLGYLQIEMAEAVGVDNSAWNHWEIGRRFPSRKNAKCIWQMWKSDLESIGYEFEDLF